MKNRACGKYFIVGIISVLILLLMAIFILIYSIYSCFSVPNILTFCEMLLGDFCSIFIFISSAVILFRIFNCYYIINDNNIEISYLVPRKGEKWYDCFFSSPYSYKYTYQNIITKFYLSDVLSISLVKDISLKGIGIRKNDLVITLRCGKNIVLKNGFFSKKQIKDLVQFMIKNKDIRLCDSVKERFIRKVRFLW